MNIDKNHAKLFEDIQIFIEKARKTVALSVNAELSMLYWNVGNRIRSETLREQRAEYGKQIIANLSAQLTMEYGRGWSPKQIAFCVRFAEVYPDISILYTLCTKLTWSHIRLIIPIEDELKRDFYIEITKLEHWSVRTLQERIGSMLYERTVISKQPEATIKNDIEKLRQEQVLSPELVFCDPYVLDFLGLFDAFSEKQLEDAILNEIQQFLIEMGSDFAFLRRQKRITIDNRDYKMDLLFYHRRLKCLVVIDLKIGEFEAAYKGQMELYLRYLEKNDTIEGENKPIGLILCTGKNEEHIELLQLDKSNIRVAEYLTLLPPKEVLLDRLHRAIAIAKMKTIV
jgi:predicted nuclease of restriction endonuclease-like (RecB) superfamily